MPTWLAHKALEQAARFSTPPPTGSNPGKGLLAAAQRRFFYRDNPFRLLFPRHRVRANRKHPGGKAPLPPPFPLELARRCLKALSNEAKKIAILAALSLAAFALAWIPPFSP